MLTRPINENWRFAFGESFQWITRNMKDEQRLVTLPHDFRIELERSDASHGGYSEGWYKGGCGQYEREITLTKEEAEGAVFLEIDGAYRFAEIRVNRNLLCCHKGGYSGFMVDLTGKVKAGENVINIITNCAMLPCSRWYTGAGLYRGVNLLTCPHKDAALLARDIFVSTVKYDEQRAVLRVLLPKDGLELSVLDQDGKMVASRVGWRRCEMIVEKPHLWNVDTPYLYTLQVNSTDEQGKVLDSASIRFGIRTIEVDAKNGLRVNGEGVLLKGGCIHHDNGLLGAVSLPQVERRKILKLKASGYNAIRCAHNPPSTALLDACDELGMLVMDEAFDVWNEGKRLFDEHILFGDHWESELEDMVLRDRNHPSIILWSIGNEIYERSGASDGVLWAHRLADKIRTLDQTRPISSALAGFFEDSDIVELAANSMDTCGDGKDYWATHSEGYAAALDVVGYNYMFNRYKKDAGLFPERVMCGTESYPKEAYENWEAVLTNSQVIGDFVWTAWEYIGESGIGHSRYDIEADTFNSPYPWHLATCGDIDLLGEKRPQSHYRDFLWTARTTPYIAVQHPVHFTQKETVSGWGWPDADENWTFAGYEGKKCRISVYNAGDKVELLCNGKKVGESATQKHIAAFEAVYTPGELTAIAYKDGKPIGTQTIRTAGTPAALDVRQEETYGDGDLRFVTVAVKDASGVLAMDAAFSVTVEVQGATLLGYASGDPETAHAYQNSTEKPYKGKLLAVVKLSGDKDAKVTFTGGGLEASLMLK